MIKYEYYNPEGASNCILRTFSKITNKNPKIIEKELIELSNTMNHQDYSDIEVFEEYISKLNLKKIENNTNIIKDLILDDKEYIIFCYDKKDYYHLVPIINKILYDKNEDTIKLYTISIYKK